MVELKKDWKTLLSDKFCGSSFCIAEEVDPDCFSQECEGCPVYELTNTCTADIKNIIETIVDKI